jgi:hypothetical protein
LQDFCFFAGYFAQLIHTRARTRAGDWQYRYLFGAAFAVRNIPSVWLLGWLFCCFLDTLCLDDDRIEYTN